MKSRLVQGILTITGAVAGGVAGYFAFTWIVKNTGGFGFAIPGVLVSLGAGFFRCPNAWIAGLCGLIGTFAGLYSAWKVAPFISDDRFSYFVRHAHEAAPAPMALILILLGGLIAFWIPLRRRPRRQ